MSVSEFYFTNLMRDTLLSSSDLEDIVDGRIFYLTIPQKTKLPCVSFQKIDGETINTLSGASGLSYFSIQIDCWSLAFENCQAMAKAIKEIMPASGPWGAHLKTHQDIYDAEIKIYRIIMEYSVWFCEDAVESV